MKFITAFAAIIMMASVLKAQENSDNGQIQTLFSKPEHIGWWISADFAYTQISDRDAWLGGMSGGVILNHSFSIGGAGYGIINSNNLEYSNVLDTANVYLYGGYGGLKLEYRFQPLKLVNVAFPLLIGGGSVGYGTASYYHNYYGHDHYDEYYADFYVWDGFFVLEPGVTVGLNLLKFMRLDVGASYRYAPAIDLPSADSNLMNGFNATMALRFGNF
jgi:hypothetical protein